MQKKSTGFTLIELIIVIVIIGILSGIAIPRFINQTRNARIAALNGMAGAVNSAVMLAQAQYHAEGAISSPVTMTGATVAVSTGVAGGLPTGAVGGIGSALRTVSGFTPTYGATTQWDFPTVIANCNVQYVAATGVVTVTTTGC